MVRRSSRPIMGGWGKTKTVSAISEAITGTKMYVYMTTSGQNSYFSIQDGSVCGLLPLSNNNVPRGHIKISE